MIHSDPFGPNGAMDHVPDVMDHFHIRVWNTDGMGHWDKAPVWVLGYTPASLQRSELAAHIGAADFSTSACARPGHTLGHACCTIKRAYGDATR